jgi:hypothetical protein
MCLLLHMGELMKRFFIQILCLTILVCLNCNTTQASMLVAKELLSEKASREGLIVEKSPISRATLSVNYEHYAGGTKVCTDLRIQPGDPTITFYSSDGVIYIHLDTSALPPDRIVGIQAFDCVTEQGELTSRRFYASGKGTILRLKTGEIIVSKVVDDDELGQLTYEVLYKDLTKLEEKKVVARSTQGVFSLGLEMSNKYIYSVNATYEKRNMGMIYSFSDIPIVTTPDHLPHFKSARINGHSRFDLSEKK